VQWFIGGVGNPQEVVCSTHVAIDNREVASSPPAPVRLEGGLNGRWYTSALAYALTNPVVDELVRTPRRDAEVSFGVDCGDQGAARWSRPLVVLPQPAIDREPGVTINDGDAFTNSPKVLLSFGWERGVLVGQVKMSNDGGFAPRQTEKSDLVTSDQPVPWTLATLGPERLPKTVYVRFGLFDLFSSQTFTDDIVLDTVKPVVVSASIGGSGAAVLAGPRMVRVRAKDNKSGLAALQVSAGKPRKGAKVLTFRKAVPAPKSGRVFVRVRDGAGNWSSWKLAM
jgi:hypothetical protein